VRPSIVVVLACSLSACGGDPDPAPDASPPPRFIVAELAVDETGFSAILDFEVPAATRSMTVVIEGADDALYGLGALRTSDAIEHVDLDLGAPPGPAMQASYNDEQIGHMPGDLYQSIRLGTFSHVYPYRPDQLLPAGATSLRVASDTAGPIRVTVLLPEDDGAATLHLNVIAVSEDLELPADPPFVDEVATLFAQADIAVVVDEVLSLSGTGLSTITDFSEPQESPGSMSAMLPSLVEDRLDGGALDVFIVDGLPFNVGGLSLGTPGPPIRGSYYYGIAVRYYPDVVGLGRVVAHEVAHFLALQHIQNTGISGAIYPDPLDDTTPGNDNLMDDGTTLTADQAFSLSRSALLMID
jgi:hypothetical protein